MWARSGSLQDVYRLVRIEVLGQRDVAQGVHACQHRREKRRAIAALRRAQAAPYGLFCQFNEWTSDAEFVYWGYGYRLDQGMLILYDGNHVSFAGREIVATAGQISYAEILRENGTRASAKARKCGRAGARRRRARTHDQFLTPLSRLFACLRTPVCDGVAASVLELLTLGIPVVASGNGGRPAGVITYDGMNSGEMVAKLGHVAENCDRVKAGTRLAGAEVNVGLMANWLTGASIAPARQEVVRVG
jgi:hypothetical protein